VSFNFPAVALVCFSPFLQRKMLTEPKFKLRRFYVLAFWGNCQLFIYLIKV